MGTSSLLAGRTELLVRQMGRAMTSQHSLWSCCFTRLFVTCSLKVRIHVVAWKEKRNDPTTWKKTMTKWRANTMCYTYCVNKSEINVWDGEEGKAETLTDRCKWSVSGTERRRQWCNAVHFSDGGKAWQTIRLRQRQILLLGLTHTVRYLLSI